MTKTLVVIASVALTLISLINFRINRIMENENATLKHKNLTISKSLENRSKHVELLYKCKPRKIDLNTKVVDENRDSLSLSEIFNNTPKLIVRFSEINCIDCISKEMSMLSEYPELRSNTICMATYHRHNDLITAKRMSGITNSVYNVDKSVFDYPMEEFGLPYYFFVNENSVASFFFVANLEDLQSTKNYLTYVSSLFK